MFRCTPLFVGAALWALASNAPAEPPFFADNFETGDLSQHDRPQWDFTGVHYGSPVILTTNPTPPASASEPELTATKFLGEFGGAQQPGTLVPALGDVVKLHLILPTSTASVVLRFDAYLLRTWDGADVQFAGPDTFGYGYNDTTLLSATFSNGDGAQSYCPGTGVSVCLPYSGSDLAAKDRLGFNVLLDPVPSIGKPLKGAPMSLLYHFTSAPISYMGGGNITFFFFSEGLQLADAPALRLADESWGIGGVNVSIATAAIPEPGTWALMLIGIALLARSVRHRGSE